MNDEIWNIHSDIEVPLRVLAPDWRTALCMGLQLLELEDAVSRLNLGSIDGGVVARDPETGHRIWVTSLVSSAAMAA
ncbi:MAG: hypothetical protein R3F61_18020 [Myxococcota bacterium]